MIIFWFVLLWILQLTATCVRTHLPTAVVNRSTLWCRAGRQLHRALAAVLRHHRRLCTECERDCRRSCTASGCETSSATEPPGSWQRANGFDQSTGKKKRKNVFINHVTLIYEFVFEWWRRYWVKDCNRDYVEYLPLIMSQRLQQRLHRVTCLNNELKTATETM